VSTRVSLESHMKKLAVGWTTAGLALTVGLALSIAYILPFQEAEDQVRAFGEAASASHRSDILSGDVLAAELQIQKTLGLSDGEQALFLGANKDKWIRNNLPLKIIECANGKSICHDYLGNKIVSYTPTYFDSEKTALWGYLYIEKHFQTNWALISLIGLAITLGMAVQTGGFYFGLSRAMETVGSTLSDWAKRLSIDPRNRKNYASAPFDEIAPIELALIDLRAEIDQLKEVAHSEGALSTLRAVGHDILNPVSRLKRILGAIDQESSNRYVLDNELLQNLQANIQRLSTYAEQLKFIYKQKIGEASNESAFTDVSAEVQKLANELRYDPDAIDKSVTIKADIDNGCLCRIPVAALGRMMENLCSNSIQASKNGGVVRINVKAAQGSVTVTIGDDGHGIPEEMKAKIFDAGVTSRPNRGTGLGLVVVKQICETYNGKLAIDSRVGAGTTMRIELPRMEI
jgi:signal transduction histidine kinase